MDNDEIDSLINSVMDVMEKSRFSKGTLKNYRLAFRRISSIAKNEGQLLFTAEFALDLISEERPATSCWDRRFRKRAVRRLCEQAGIVDEVFPKPDPFESCPERFREDLLGFRDYEMKRRLGETTIRERMKAAIGFMTFLDERVERLEDVTVEDVDAYFIDYSRTNGPVTVQGRRYDVKEILRFLDQKHEMGGRILAAMSDGARGVRPGLQTFLSPDEMRRMLKAAEGVTRHPKRTTLIVAFLMQYPIRGVELRRLKISDIDWSEGTVTVRASKNGESRCYPLTNTMRLIIVDYLKNERPPSEADELIVSTFYPFFPLKNPSSIGGIVRKVARAAGIPLEGQKVGSHAIRRSVATTLMEKDVPYPVISEMLMHKWSGTAFSGTTMTYLKADMEALRGIMLEVPHAR